MNMPETGRWLCETCFDAMTDTVITKDGLEQACCTACREPVDTAWPWYIQELQQMLKRYADSSIRQSGCLALGTVVEVPHGVFSVRTWEIAAPLRYVHDYREEMAD